MRLHTTPRISIITYVPWWCSPRGCAASGTPPRGPPAAAGSVGVFHVCVSEGCGDHSVVTLFGYVMTSTFHSNPTTPPPPTHTHARAPAARSPWTRRRRPCRSGPPPAPPQWRPGRAGSPRGRLLGSPVGVLLGGGGQEGGAAWPCQTRHPGQQMIDRPPLIHPPTPLPRTSGRSRILARDSEMRTRASSCRTVMGTVCCPSPSLSSARRRTVSRMPTYWFVGIGCGVMVWWSDEGQRACITDKDGRMTDKCTYTRPSHHLSTYLAGERLPRLRAQARGAALATVGDELLDRRHVQVPLRRAAALNEKMNRGWVGGYLAICNIVPKPVRPGPARPSTVAMYKRMRTCCPRRPCGALAFMCTPMTCRAMERSRSSSLCGGGYEGVVCMVGKCRETSHMVAVGIDSPKNAWRRTGCRAR